MSDPAFLIEQMYARSRRKLYDPKNIAKGSWLSMTDAEVINRIWDEITELEKAMSWRHDKSDDVLFWERVADEAADVYHFASMGADTQRISGRLKAKHEGRPYQGGEHD